jgi:hypothetical protein
VPTPSTDGGSSTARSVGRDLRDSRVFRVVLLVAILLLAFGLTRGCASAGRNVSSDEAVEIARESVDEQRDKHQVRFVQQGIPPHPYWAVSLYDVNARGRWTNVTVVLVDAETGRVVRRTT